MKYAITDMAGNVLNIIVLDEGVHYEPPEDTRLIHDKFDTAEIGKVYCETKRRFV
jgi:hypothetical protein